MSTSTATLFAYTTFVLSRTLHAARRPHRQHHLGPGRGHREAARQAWHRQMAGVRRLLGIDARAGVRANAPETRDRAGAARHLHAAALGTGMVLPGGRVATVPRDRKSTRLNSSH